MEIEYHKSHATIKSTLLNKLQQMNLKHENQCLLETEKEKWRRFFKILSGSQTVKEGLIVTQIVLSAHKTGITQYIYKLVFFQSGQSVMDHLKCLIVWELQNRDQSGHISIYWQSVVDKLSIDKTVQVCRLMENVAILTD